MMRIGIDMRMAGTGEGIARYVTELVSNLVLLDKFNSYFLVYTGKFPAVKITLPNNFHFARVKSPYYSWTEQTRLIWELRRLKLDVMHFPSFNAPIFYPGNSVITIHDIIHHLYPGKKKSRFFHRFAYRLAINSAVRRAKKIITVSKQTEKDILSTFHPDKQKLEVIHEGVGVEFKTKQSESELKRIRKIYQINGPYLLFVGVWRQYKNLARLAQAFDIIKEQTDWDGQLVLVGKIDPFYPEIRQAVEQVKFAKDINILGYVPDGDLPALYQGAKVFVLPSLLEGFGLIGVEAQASGTPVVASDIPVLREILGEGAIYINPKNLTQIAESIQEVLKNEALRQELIQKGLKNARKYSWIDTAKQTLKIYEEANGGN